jgi:hypothetical protein
MVTKDLDNDKSQWQSPKIEELGDAKELVNSAFSELFDQKNSSAQVDFFNANIS